MGRTAEEIRRDRNREVLEKYRAGDSLADVSPQATHFPPRPIIKKDPELVARVYGEEKPDSRGTCVVPAKPMLP
jgi:hypothetical protein